jgi:hypothetical protein
VQFIADEFDIDILMQQTCSDHTDIAVVECGHLVAEMAQVSHAVTVGIKEFSMSGSGVNC